MCNAWNHPPGCTCGWGGVNHGNVPSGGRGLNRFASDPRFAWAHDNAESYPSYVDHNATCPVCGASVFFYQSASGGRVFFDELGPPWPKHPCTDNPRAMPPIPRDRAAVLRADPPSQVPAPPMRRPPWLAAGWLPFTVTDTYDGADAAGVFRALVGQVLREGASPADMVVRVREAFRPGKWPVFLRFEDGKTVEVATLVEENEDEDDGYYYLTPRKRLVARSWRVG